MDPDSLQRVSQGRIQRLISAPRRALYILIVNTLGSVGSLEPTLSNNPAFKDRSTLKHKKHGYTCSIFQVLQNWQLNSITVGNYLFQLNYNMCSHEQQKSLTIRAMATPFITFFNDPTPVDSRMHNHNKL